MEKGCNGGLGAVAVNSMTLGGKHKSVTSWSSRLVELIDVIEVSMKKIP